MVVVFRLVGGQPNIQNVSIRKAPFGFFSTFSDAARTFTGVGPRIDSDYNQ